MRNLRIGVGIACLFVIIAHENVYAADEDLRPDISEEEYLQGVMNQEADLQRLEEDVEAARTTLDLTLARLADANAEFEDATALFSEAESDTSDPDKLPEAWRAVAAAWRKLEELTETRDRQEAELLEVEQRKARDQIWLEKYKNDYEAQSDAFAVRDAIARCASASCSSSGFLADERMAVFQPNVLEMIGAHHAYARGLTGKGVRIGIDDDIVSYRLPEFEGRISFEGANLLYTLFPSDDRYSNAETCDQATGSEREELKCRVFSYSSGIDNNLFDTLALRYIIARNGWPGEGETYYLRNDAYEDGDLYRWAIVPHGGRGGNAEGDLSTHGTAVASVAAGRDFGVAPGATIVPIAKDFSSEGQSAQTRTERSLLSYIRGLPEDEQAAIDSGVAEAITDGYSNYDIINRSFGIPVFDPASISALLDDETQWWGEGFRKILPQTWRAIMQTGVHPDERTVVVYSAGNSTEEFSGLWSDPLRLDT